MLKDVRPPFAPLLYRGDMQHKQCRDADLRLAFVTRVEQLAPSMVTLPCPPDCRSAAQLQISLRLQRQKGMTAWAALMTCSQTILPRL